MAFLEGRELSKTSIATPRCRWWCSATWTSRWRRARCWPLSGRRESASRRFLHLLGGLDRADSGTVRVDDKELTSMSPDELARSRNRNVGFVFQFHHLLPEFSAMENVAMPAGSERWIATSVGKGGRSCFPSSACESGSGIPDQPSGGEQRRRGHRQSAAGRAPCCFWRTSHGESRTSKPAKKCSI